MSTFKRTLSPLKALRSDVEFTITALAACSVIEAIVRPCANDSEFSLSTCLNQGADGVRKTTSKNSAVLFTSDRSFLTTAEKEIFQILTAQAQQHPEGIESFYYGNYRFYYIYTLIILMNDYAGHNITRAQEGVSRLSMVDTITFNSAFRNMMRSALAEYSIDEFLLDPLESGLVNWQNLETRAR